MCVCMCLACVPFLHRELGEIIRQEVEKRGGEGGGRGKEGGREGVLFNTYMHTHVIGKGFICGTPVVSDGETMVSHVTTVM